VSAVTSSHQSNESLIVFTVGGGLYWSHCSRTRSAGSFGHEVETHDRSEWQGPVRIALCRPAKNPWLRRWWPSEWKLRGKIPLDPQLHVWSQLIDPVQEGQSRRGVAALRKIMSKLKLTVNEEKTRIGKVPEGEFDFLGEVVQRDLELLGESDPFDCKSAS
jgi:hypothetical protein